MKTAEEYLKDQLNEQGLGPLKWTSILDAIRQAQTDAIDAMAREYKADTQKELLKYGIIWKDHLNDTINQVSNKLKQQI